MDRISQTTHILEKNSHKDTKVAFDFEIYTLVEHPVAFP